jgi:hypothetical protein
MFPTSKNTILAEKQNPAGRSLLTKGLKFVGTSFFADKKPLQDAACSKRACKIENHPIIHAHF